MLTVLPLQGLSLANHFTKATSFAIYDQQGVLVKQLDNPALESGCDGKSRLVEMLGMNQVSRVIVKNIGERMLGKLLDCNMTVKQMNLRGGDIATIFNQITQFPELNDAAQGRESVNYHRKQQQGGCCSHEHVGEHHSAEKKSCCGSKHGSGRGGCCKH